MTPSVGGHEWVALSIAKGQSLFHVLFEDSFEIQISNSRPKKERRSRVLEAKETRKARGVENKERNQENYKQQVVVQAISIPIIARP